MATRITIGELARRTGVAVRTLRFYSDRGLIAPAERSAAGYRLYEDDAVARVALVRTLRELGVGLPAIRRVLDRELDLAAVAAAHAAALDAQIRVLRMSRTIARLVARQDTTAQEMTRMHDLARLSHAERRRIVDDFLDEVLGDLDVDATIAARMRTAHPDLPDDPTPEQVEAWIELAQLVADRDFRERIRAMSERGAAAREAAQTPARREAAQLVAERAGAALEAGIEPGSIDAEPIVDALAGALATAYGRVDGADFRAWLVDTLATFTDRRAERYWQLLAVVNGWPQRPATVPAWEWLRTALSAP